jgi:hypothetical protein
MLHAESASFAYADARKAIVFECGVLAVQDLASGVQHQLTPVAPPRCPRYTAVADDLLVTASGDTVTLWDLAPPIAKMAN